MAKKRVVKYRTEKLGEIEIDTGTLIIVDPCRVDDLNLTNIFDGEGQIYGEPYKDGRKRKTAVISSTGIGDGRYPIFAEIVTTPGFGERVAALHIHLDPEYCFADDPETARRIKENESKFLSIMNGK